MRFQFRGRLLTQVGLGGLREDSFFCASEYY
jgi:hypothetical protein